VTTHRTLRPRRLLETVPLHLGDAFTETRELTTATQTVRPEVALRALGDYLSLLEEPVTGVALQMRGEVLLGNFVGGVSSIGLEDEVETALSFVAVLSEILYVLPVFFENRDAFGLRELPSDEVVHLWVGLFLHFLAVRFIAEELFGLQVADLPLEDLKIGQFSILLVLALPLLLQGLALGDQGDSAPLDHPGLQGLCGLRFCPALALLGVLLAEVEGDQGLVLRIEDQVFLVGDVQHIIAFIISMHLLFRMGRVGG